MARYKFRLETLHKLCELRRDEQRAALAEAFRAEAILAEQRAELAAEERALRELQRAATRGRYIDVNRLIEAQRYELVLKAKQQEISRQQTILATETERRRLALAEADRDVRALDRLNERHYMEHLRKQRQVEQKQLDERSLERHMHSPPKRT